MLKANFEKSCGCKKNLCTLLYIPWIDPYRTLLLQKGRIRIHSL